MLAYNGTPDFKNHYYRPSYYSTEKIQSEIYQYSFRSQSHLHTTKHNNTIPYLPKMTMSSALFTKHDLPSTIQSQTKQILFFYHTYFLYSIIPSSNFYLCNNLSSIYSRNPRTPANHSVSIE